MGWDIRRRVPGQRGPFAARLCHQRSWNHFPDVEQAKDEGLEVKEQKYLPMLKRDRGSVEVAQRLLVIYLFLDPLSAALNPQ